MLLVYLKQLIPCNAVSEMEVDNSISSYILQGGIGILTSLWKYCIRGNVTVNK